MSGKRAKAIRARIYGDQSRRVVEYQWDRTGRTIRCVGLRGKYLAAKRKSK